MNVTYLIGNGFDVNLGLPTKFSDYYSEYKDSIKDILVTPSKRFDEAAKNAICDFWHKINEPYTNWANFESAIAKFSEKNELNVKNVLSDFTVKFSEYLNNICRDYECSDDVAVEFVQFILKGYLNLQRHDRMLIEPMQIGHYIDNTSIFFINFNYTDSIEKILHKFKEQHLGRSVIHSFSKNNSTYHALLINDVLHIHGSLNDENRAVIGIDSIEQFTDERLKHNESVGVYCVKAQINDDTGYSDKERQFEETIRLSNIIYTYGVSFGETDRSRWQVLSSWLEKNESHKLVVYYYESNFDEYKSTYERILLDHLDELKKEIMEKLELSTDEFDRYKNQIYIIDSSDVLKCKFIRKEIGNHIATEYKKPEEQTV